jgi:hypothetical protein
VAKSLEQLLSPVPPAYQQDKEKTKVCTFKCSSIKNLLFLKTGLDKTART